LPLVLEDKLLGCLYFDNGPDVVDLTDTLRTLLLQMRDHLVAAFAKYRQVATETAA
jgi:hypothetical protein